MYFLSSHCAQVIRLAMPRNGLTLSATISLVICEGDSDDSVLSMKLSWLSMNSLYLSSLDLFTWHFWIRYICKSAIPCLYAILYACNLNFSLHLLQLLLLSINCCNDSADNKQCPLRFLTGGVFYVVSVIFFVLSNQMVSSSTSLRVRHPLPPFAIEEGRRVPEPLIFLKLVMM